MSPVFGNSLVTRGVSLSRKIVISFWTKYVVPRQIKPRVLELSIRRGQNNLGIFFLFVSCREKKTIIVSFRRDRSVLTFDRTAGAAWPYARMWRVQVAYSPKTARAISSHPFLIPKSLPDLSQGTRKSLKYFSWSSQENSLLFAWKERS